MDRATMLGEGKMDAYLIAEVGSKKLKTEIKTTIRDECTWNQTMNIPVKMPLMASKLIIKLYDDDPAGDEICGSLIFDYKTLLKMEKGSVFWVNVSRSLRLKHYFTFVHCPIKWLYDILKRRTFLVSLSI